MFLAGYMVTGFLLASVYAVGMLRGRTDRYVRLGFAIPFTVAIVVASVPGQQSATSRPAAIFADQPAKFAAMELITGTGPDQPVTIGGILVDGEGGRGLSRYPVSPRISRASAATPS